MPKLVAPNVRIDFIPDASVTDYLTLTAANLNSNGVNISCAVQVGYTMNPTDSDTDDSPSICDESNVTTYTYPNYEVELPMFRDDDLADSVSVYNIAYNLFKGGPIKGLFVRRVGKKSSVAYTASERIDIFGGETDFISHTDENNSPKIFTVRLIPDGRINTEQPLL